MPPFVTLASAGSQTLHRVKAPSRVAEMSVMQRIARHYNKTVLRRYSEILAQFRRLLRLTLISTANSFRDLCVESHADPPRPVLKTAS